jgi:hypothetical protein
MHMSTSIVLLLLCMMLLWWWLLCIFKSNFGLNFSLQVVLRITWIVTISPESFGINLQPPFITMLIGSIEIYRRFQWNVLRMEHEFANNCDNFRVTKEIPLPGKQRSLFATHDAGCCYGLCDKVDKREESSVPDLDTPSLSRSSSLSKIKGKNVSAPSIARLLSSAETLSKESDSIHSVEESRDTFYNITEEEAESISTFELPPTRSTLATSPGHNLTVFPAAGLSWAAAAGAVTTITPTPTSVALTVADVYGEAS